SGCQSVSIIIWAPRLEPPCSTRCVSFAISSSQETDPDDFPFTPRASVSLGRNVDPFVPTPPPRDIISITSFLCSDIPSLEYLIKCITQQLKYVTSVSDPVPYNTRPA